MPLAVLATAVPPSRGAEEDVPAGHNYTTPNGGLMITLSDPATTLCTAVVAGVAFGLLLLGNKRR